MKKIKLFEEFLLEFDYGKQLFADPDTIAGTDKFKKKDYTNWLKSIGSKIESDTEEEEDILQDFMDYFENGIKVWQRHIKTLIGLKKKYPQMLDPQAYFDFDTAYRGASIPMEQFIRIVNNSKAWKTNMINGYLKKLKETEPASKLRGSIKTKTKIKQQNWIKKFVDEKGKLLQIHDIKGEAYQSRGDKGFISLSTNPLDAKKFMLEYQLAHIRNGRMPVVIHVDYSKIAKKAFMNPEFVAKLTTWEEDEFLVEGSELPIKEITFPNPLTAYLFDDKLDRETQLKVYKALFDYEED
jgi:hypothetical protein